MEKGYTCKRNYDCPKWWSCEDCDNKVRIKSQCTSWRGCPRWKDCSTCDNRKEINNINEISSDGKYFY